MARITQSPLNSFFIRGDTRPVKRDCISSQADANGGLCCMCLAGGESLTWHPLVEDFITLGRKLEGLGFVYNKGAVLIVERMEEANEL